MGIRAKNLMKKKLSKAFSARRSSEAAPNYLPLEGGAGKEITVQSPPKNTSTVLYIGRIPHGFYEEEMQSYFSQFGNIKRLRIARNKKTGKSKHFGFIQFENPEVAEVVAECMHNYLLFEHLLQVHLIPPEQVHPRLWKGFNYRSKPVNRVKLERNLLDKERTPEEQAKYKERILKNDQKRRKRIESAGIEYECPPIVGINPVSKKIKKSKSKKIKIK